MRLQLIVNSSASSVNARTRVAVTAALGSTCEVETIETTRRGHAARLARGAAATGVDIVAVLGGDGTLNEAANGLVGTRTALAPLPGGSTNVFARTLGLPNDAIDAARLTAQSLATPDKNVRTVGLGRANDRYFLFHVGLGFDAALVERVESRGPLKRWAGHLLFGWAGVTAWMRHYDHRRPRFAVRFADGSAALDSVFAVIANTNPYTYLGNRPFDIAPTATLDRSLTAVTVRDLRFVRTLQLVSAALRSPDALAQVKGVGVHPDVTDCDVVGYGPFPYQIDGEAMGDVERLDIRHVPNVLRLVMPSGSASNGRLPDHS